MSYRDFSQLVMEMNVADCNPMFFKHVRSNRGDHVCESCGATGVEGNDVYECQTFSDLHLTERDFQTGGDLSYCSNCLEQQLKGDVWADDVQVTWHGNSLGSGCTKCSGHDAETHSTEEHREDYMDLLEPCEECGVPAGVPCKPSCSFFGQ